MRASRSRTTFGPAPPVGHGAGAAVQAATAQLGKPYEWGGAGPDSFDCSGLTMWAWRAGGVGLSHSAAAQYSETAHVSLADIQPGDLVFYGSPISHVGIYVGGGQMINAPHTGDVVRYASIDHGGMPVGIGRPG
jgi:cell wall-associated NlpC family hydrolase